MDKNKHYALGLIELAELHDLSHVEIYKRIHSFIVASKVNRPVYWVQDRAFIVNFKELADNYKARFKESPDYEAVLKILKGYAEKEIKKGDKIEWPD